MSNYLTDIQMASLVEAIQTAETFSTGEIRIHIDSTTEDEHAKTALQIFHHLKMHKTTHRNAVLFHINFDKKYLTILGDIGIHQHVQQIFWDRMHDEITNSFSKGNYFQGLKSAVLKTGIELKKHFPTSGENLNELPNEITFS